MGYLFFFKYISLPVLIVIFLVSCVTSSWRDDGADALDADGMEKKARAERIVELSEKLSQTPNDIESDIQNYATILALAQSEPEVYTNEISYSTQALEEIFSSLVYKVSSIPSGGLVARSYEEPLVIQVVSRELPLANTLVSVEETLQEADGEEVVSTVFVRTDAEGYAQINLTTPPATGTHRIFVSIAAENALTPIFPEEAGVLSSASINEETVEQLASIIDAQRTLIRIAIVSQAAEYSMNVYVQDTDISDSIIEGENTATGIVQILSEAGFVVSIIPVKGEVETLSLSEVFTSSDADRVAYGTAKIMSFEESAGGYSVELNASVDVYDRRTGAELLSIRRTQRGDGANSSSTVLAVFRVLGTKIAEEMLRGLP